MTRTQRARRSQRGGAVSVPLIGIARLRVLCVLCVDSARRRRVAAAQAGQRSAAASRSRRAAAQVERRPGVADLGTPRGARRARSPALGRLPGVGAARRVRDERGRPRGDGSAQRDVRAARARDHAPARPSISRTRDKFYHNVFSLSKTRPFDLGRYAAGHSRPVRFDRAGIVRVFCDIHSHMNAFILVFSHPFFAMTDARRTLSHRQRAAGHLRRRSPGTKARRRRRGR